MQVAESAARQRKEQSLQVNMRLRSILLSVKRESAEIKEINRSALPGQQRLSRRPRLSIEKLNDNFDCQFLLRFGCAPIGKRRRPASQSLRARNNSSTLQHEAAPPQHIDSDLMRELLSHKMKRYNDRQFQLFERKVLGSCSSDVLDLSNAGLTPNCIVPVLQIIARSSAIKYSISNNNFKGCIEDLFHYVLKKDPVSFLARSIGMRPADFSRVLPFFRHNQRLEVLDLSSEEGFSRNVVSGVEATTNLGEIVQSCRFLQQLHLDYLELSEEQFTLFCSYISSHESLKLLSVRRNSLGQSTGFTLHQVLRGCRLQQLVLAKNPGIGDGGASSLATMLSNQHSSVSLLDVSGCKLSGHGFMRFVFNFSKNIALRTIDFSNNVLSSMPAKVTQFVAYSRISHLLFNCCNLTNEAVRTLFDSTKERVLQSIQLRNNLVTGCLALGSIKRIDLSFNAVERLQTPLPQVVREVKLNNNSLRDGQSLLQLALAASVRLEVYNNGLGQFEQAIHQSWLQEKDSLRTKSRPQTALLPMSRAKARITRTKAI